MTNLGSGNRASGNEATAVAFLGAVCNDGGLHVPNHTVGIWGAPQTEVGLANYPCQ